MYCKVCVCLMVSCDHNLELQLLPLTQATLPSVGSTTSTLLRLPASPVWFQPSLSFIYPFTHSNNGLLTLTGSRYFLMIYSHKDFLCLCIWLGVTDWMGPALAPHVICVVADRAGSSLAASYELPVNKHVWKRCHGWGTAAWKGTPTPRPDWSHYQQVFDFHMQKAQVEERCVAPRSSRSANCVHVVWLSDHAGAGSGRQRAKCERWWILNVLKMIY